MNHQVAQKVLRPKRMKVRAMEAAVVIRQQNLPRQRVKAVNHPTRLTVNQNQNRVEVRLLTRDALKRIQIEEPKSDS